MTARCYVCGAPAAADADPRNPTCDRCKPARDHVVSMRREGPFHVAECACGWDYKGPNLSVRDRAVQAHWRRIVKDSVR